MTRKILVQLPANQVDLFLTKQSLEELHQLGEIVWNPHDRIFTEEELKEQLQGVHTVITSWKSAKITDAVLEASPDLRLIAHMAGSVKPILTPNVYDRGIRVLNSNYAIAVSVAENVLALILALGHKMISVDHTMKSGATKKHAGMEAFELRGKAVGLVGLGMVAREAIKLLSPFQVKLLGYDPYVSPEAAQELGVELASLEEVLSRSSIISLHAPKVPETYHMINRSRLALIRDGSLLINTSRGDVIDEEALLDELRTGRFSAALDVFTVEPLAADSELRHLDNVIARPHLAGVNPDSRLRIGKLMVKELAHFYNGRPLKFEVKREQLAIMT
jgi:phosphoglycerate dehydrogenase-like enzyme